MTIDPSPRSERGDMSVLKKGSQTLPEFSGPENSPVCQFIERGHARDTWVQVSHCIAAIRWFHTKSTMSLSNHGIQLRAQPRQACRSLSLAQSGLLKRSGSKPVRQLRDCNRIVQYIRSVRHLSPARTSPGLPIHGSYREQFL